jgi:hypothetical protein
VLLQPLSRHSTTVDPDLDRAGPDRPPRRRRSLRRRIAILSAIVLGSIALIIGIAVGVMLFLTRNTASPYGVGQALQQFKLLQKRGSDEVAKTPAHLPAPGVYMYSTTGSESASAPGLPSNGSDYPTTSAMTVFAGGCGQDWRWQPLSNRYEDLAVCRSGNGAIVLRSRFDTEEFYGVTDKRTFDCASGSLWLPATPAKGETLSGTCTNAGNKNSGGISIAYRGEVVGTGDLVIGGVSVPAIHVALGETMTGDTVGTGSVSLWIDGQNGLILRESRTETTRSDSAVGWVPSTEVMSLALESLKPRS